MAQVVVLAASGRLNVAQEALAAWRQVVNRSRHIEHVIRIMRRSTIAAAMRTWRVSNAARKARARGALRAAAVLDRVAAGELPASLTKWMARYTAALLAHRGPSSLVAQMGSIHRNMPLKGPRCAHPQHCTQPSHIAVACFDTHRLFLLVAACCGCRNYQEA